MRSGAFQLACALLAAVARAGDVVPAVSASIEGRLTSGLTRAIARRGPLLAHSPLSLSLSLL